MDYLIAVTDNDAVNIMGALIADRCGIRRKIARVRSLGALGQNDAILTADDLKIDLVIRPEELTAQEIARLLKIRAGNVVIDIAERQMQVVATRIDESSPVCRGQSQGPVAEVRPLLLPGRLDRPWDQHHHSER